VALRWQGTRGFNERGLLVATVVRYDRSELSEPGPDALRRNVITGHYFVAFVNQERVPGEFATEDEAKEAAEQLFHHQ